MKLLAVCFLLAVSSVMCISGRQLQQGAGNCLWVNEVLPQPEGGAQEFIELYSSCPAATSLAGYSVQDQGNNQAPLGAAGCTASIPPQGFLVLTKSDACGYSFGLKADDGVALLDSSGKAVNVANWTRADVPRGQSFSRLPDGSGTTGAGKPTPGAANAKAAAVAVPTAAAKTAADLTVVVNEIDQNNPKGEKTWVELYNYGTAPVDLTGAALGDENYKTGPGAQFLFGQPGCTNTTIPAGGFLVLEHDVDCSFKFGLGNSDDVVLLLGDAVVDELKYGPKNDLLELPEGVTIGRLPDGKDGKITYLTPTKGAKNAGEVSQADMETQLAQQKAAKASAKDQGSQVGRYRRVATHHLLWATYCT